MRPSLLVRAEEAAAAPAPPKPEIGPKRGTTVSSESFPQQLRQSRLPMEALY